MHALQNDRCEASVDLQQAWKVQYFSNATPTNHFNQREVMAGASTRCKNSERAAEPIFWPPRNLQRACVCPGVRARQSTHVAHSRRNDLHSCRHLTDAKASDARRQPKWLGAHYSTQVVNRKLTDALHRSICDPCGTYCSAGPLFCSI